MRPGLQEEAKMDVVKGTHRSSQAGLDGDGKPVILREKYTLPESLLSSRCSVSPVASA